MAVLKKIRSRLFAPPPAAAEAERTARALGQDTTVAKRKAAATDGRYDVRPMTVPHLDECWRLDQCCFVDGEAYSRETFEYLLTSPEVVAYRAVTHDGVMVGFIVGLTEPHHTGHITTIGVAPEHRRRGVARLMLAKVEESFRRHDVRTIRLEVRSINIGAQTLYRNLGFVVTQRLPRYYSNGGDGLLMVKPLE